MAFLLFDNDDYDIIWSEGAIYNTGLEKRTDAIDIESNYLFFLIPLHKASSENNPIAFLH